MNGLFLRTGGQRSRLQVEKTLTLDSNSNTRNACHGSDSPSSAEREIEIIFPHIFQEDDPNEGGNQNQRPGTTESAMINGHTIPIRSPKTVFEVNQKSELVTMILSYFFQFFFWIESFVNFLSVIL